MPPPAGRDADRSGVMTKRVGLYLRVSTKNGQEEQVAGAPTRKAALYARHRHIDPQRQTLWRAEWIRTFSSALDRQQFVVSSEFGRSTVAHGHPSSCRPRRTDRVVGRCPERRHSPPGSDGVTPRSRCRRCERIAEPKVRIRSPPAESLQTFSSSRAATAMAKPDTLHSRTGSSNPVPSSGESDELSPEQARSPVGSRGCPLLGSRGGDREDQAQRPDKTVGTKHARDKNGR